MQCVNYSDTNKIMKAIELGTPFYIDFGVKKLKVIDPDIEEVRTELFSKLDAAKENDKYIPETTFWNNMDNA